jgi:hypothetical protein
MVGLDQAARGLRDDAERPSLKLSTEAAMPDDTLPMAQYLNLDPSL